MGWSLLHCEIRNNYIPKLGPHWPHDFRPLITHLRAWRQRGGCTLAPRGCHLKTHYRAVCLLKMGGWPAAPKCHYFLSSALESRKKNFFQVFCLMYSPCTIRTGGTCRTAHSSVTAVIPSAAPLCLRTLRRIRQDSTKAASNFQASGLNGCHSAFSGLKFKMFSPSWNNWELLCDLLCFRTLKVVATGKHLIMMISNGPESCSSEPLCEPQTMFSWKRQRNQHQRQQRHVFSFLYSVRGQWTASYWDWNKHI